MSWVPSDDDAPDAPPRRVQNGQGKVLSFDEAARARAALHEAEARAKWPLLGVPDIFAELEPIDYLVKDLDICPGAPTLLAAYGFSGKTLVTQAMALAIASGSRVWDSFPAKQGRVLHIDYEQGARLSRDRYQRLAKGMQLVPEDLGDRLSLVSMPQHYLDVPDSEQFMLRACDGYSLAIVDSFRACSPTVDENDSEARIVLDRLTRVSEKTGCCFIVIHHARKPNRDGSKGQQQMDIRGSGALFDACACVLHLGASSKDEELVLTQSKARNRGTKAPELRIDIHDVQIGEDPRAGLVVRAIPVQPLGRADPAQTKAADNEQFRSAVIRAFLVNREPKSKNAITHLVNLRRSSVLGAIDLMISKGELVSEKGGFSLHSSALIKEWDPANED